MTTLLVIQHEDEDPVGLLGAEWVAEGIDLDIRCGWVGDPVPTVIDPAEHAGVVVLGGYMGADDDHEHAWLTPTKALLRAVVRDGIPTLGICLGHQLLASALGGSVGRNPAGRTLGMAPIGWEPAAADDALVTGLGGGLGDLPVLHYNDDVILDLPDGAVVLARTADGAPQVVRFAPTVWGVQFHPEVEVEMFTSWSDVPAEVTRAAYAAQPALRLTGTVIAARFAALLPPVSTIDQ